MITKIDNVLSFYKDVMDKTTFGNEDFPLSFNLVSEKSKKLIVVIGDNASGKSLLTSQMLNCANKWANMKGYNVGMKSRTQEGLGRVFMYKQEEDNSTGAITLHSIIGGLTNCVNHANEGTPMMLVLDEPTLGLSMRYERAMGQYITNIVNENKDNENFKGILLVTHSKDMVRSMIDNGFDPSVVSVGGKIENIDEWIDSKESATVEELLSLSKKGIDTWRTVRTYFNDLKAKKH